RLERGQDCRLVSKAIPEGEPSYGVPLARAGSHKSDAPNEQKPLTCDTNWGKISYDSRRVEMPRENTGALNFAGRAQVKQTGGAVLRGRPLRARSPIPPTSHSARPR